MKKIIVLLLLVFPVILNASSESYVVMDADSGRVLESSKMNEKYLIASTTKIMTAIVALENGNLDDKFISSNIIKEVYGSMIYAKEGEEFSLEDLLYGLMLRSGNDASMIIAESIGNLDSFISKMNETSTKIGMKNTNFQNPHGLDNETENYSTAYDLTLLMRYAMRNKDFRKITSTKKYIVKTNMMNYEWYNKNKLLSIYKYATGGKIGYTDKSKHVFVSSATKDGKNLIIASIKDTDRFNTHKSLYEKNFQKYEKYKVLDKYTFSLIDKNFKNYYLYIKNDFNVLLKKEEINLLELDIILNKKPKNNVVGKINIMLGDNIIHSEKIYGVTKENKIIKIKNIFSKIFK